MDEPIINLAPPQAPADVIKDSSTATFMEDVIQASREAPVIVDFWAPWCGPCKQLGPVLEKLVRAAGGAVKLVKINVDENQALAQQLRIQSIPAVYAFYQGQPMDGFAGALPESQVKAFVDRLVAAAGGEPAASPIEEALAQAKESAEAGDDGAAAAIYRQILEHEPDNVAAAAGLARGLMEAGAHAEARAVIEALPAASRDDAEIAAVQAGLDLAEKTAQSAGDLVGLQAAVEADPANHQARYDYALALYAAGQREEAVDELLVIVKRARDWNDHAARKQLLQFFEAQGPTDPLTLSGRRKLSSLLFS